MLLADRMAIGAGACDGVFHRPGIDVVAAEGLPSASRPWKSNTPVRRLVAAPSFISSLAPSASRCVHCRSLRSMTVGDEVGVVVRILAVCSEQRRFVGAGELSMRRR
jgi:hypothetical protein